MISDSELYAVFSRYRFGNHRTPRQIINRGVFEISCGFRTGFTLQCILIDFGLIGKKTCRLTKKGKQYMWDNFKDMLKEHEQKTLQKELK